MNPHKLLLLSTLLIISIIAGKSEGQNKTGEDWEWYCVGECEIDTTTITSPGVVLMGGGPDVSVAFQWMIKLSGGGNFVVLRTDGTDAYNPWIYQMGGIASVSTIIMSSAKASSDPFVLSQIANAEALWFAGGDQSEYISYWNNTAVQDALHSLVTKGVPIGGTSAGMAVLPQFVYTAMTDDSATSNESLANPYNKDITIGEKFLSIPLLDNVITVSYTFLARLMEDQWVTAGTTVRAVCGDEQSAVMLDTTSGIGTITSPDGAFVYLLSASLSPSICQPDTPLSFSNIHVQRVASGDSFNFNTWSIVSGGIQYTINATDGILSSSNNSIY